MRWVIFRFKPTMGSPFWEDSPPENSTLWADFPVLLNYKL